MKSTLHTFQDSVVQEFAIHIYFNTYVITASSNPTNGGFISGIGSYNSGQTASLTATPAAGYDFVNWTEDSIEVSTDSTYNFIVTKSIDLVANFDSIRTSVVSLDNNSILLKIYPNPTNDIINIIPSLYLGRNFIVKIIDVSGKQVYVKKINQLFADKVYEIDMSNLNYGIYYLQISNNSKLLKIEKIIKN